MLLSTLLSDLSHIPATVDCDIAFLELDSRKVNKQTLFLAIKSVHKGIGEFVADAINHGAKAVLLEVDLPNEAIHFQGQVPIIPIYDLRKHLGKLAAQFYNFPAKKLRMIGVTGTNGKTSCTHFIAQALQVPCGLIGTLGYGFYGALADTGMTTPDAIALQARLNDFVKANAKAVAMEVSSHGIDQGRINGIDFELAIFTNLTQDHLDYHGSIEAYARTKLSFLASKSTQRVIINIDDAYGKQWLNELKQEKAVYGYSTHLAPAEADYPLVCALNHQLSLEGLHARVYTPWGEGDLHLPLIGQFNLSNALAVLTTLCVYGMPLPLALQRLSTLHAVPGRMQTLGGKGKPLVVVDYSHTPDALEKALSALRPHTEGELICIFGCGGDRDASKRPLMAKIAERLADKVIVTSDNPRHEQPAEIAKQIMHGFVQPDRVLLELDRSKAIENSIQLAKYNDCILVAGKGAERYQQIGDEKLPFDDIEKAKTCLSHY